jgi:hypothetical protein
VLPLDLAGRLVEAQHAFRAGGLLAIEVVDLDVVAGHVIHEEHVAAGDRGAGVAAGDGRSPEDARADFGESLQQLVFAPDVIALGAHPLRPLVSQGGEREDRSKREHSERLHGSLLGGFRKRFRNQA